MVMKCMQRYQVAIYIRLSKEDDSGKEGHGRVPSCGKESNSIMMQRILLRRYVEENFSDYDLYEFCDDGYTGTNFERPGMQHMLEAVRNAEINCIIVKDFSRFARDYIELGSYLEEIFPFLGVRFISVNDKYDSDRCMGSIADMDVNFKNLMYDLYSKDLSEKVRSSLAVRKEQGKYVSANSPFGYEKSPTDRHALLIAEDEAEIVRRIYALTVERYTPVEIARLFNETHVKTPIEFKIEKGKTKRVPKGERFLWSSSTICKILRNEIYTGSIVQKKYKKDFVGGKNHIKPREEWMTSYSHHEPIIGREVFEEVQKGRGKKRNPQHTKTHPLTGKLVCGCCKRNLCYRAGCNPYFFCPYRCLNAMEHCVEKVNAMFLEQYILCKMQEKLQADGGIERLCEEEVSRLAKAIKDQKDKRSSLSAKIQKIKQQNFEAYQDYASGKTDSFHSGEARVKSMEDELISLNREIQNMEAAYRNMEGKCTQSWFAVLSKEMTERYVEQILVYAEGHIEISWKEKSVFVGNDGVEGI